MFRTILSVAGIAVILAGCTRPIPPSAVPPPEPDDGSIPLPRLVEQPFPNESLARGVTYLLKQQSADGAWRSDVYATFKDGTALTPLALLALLDAAEAGQNRAESLAARKKAAAWLAKFAQADGTIHPGPDGFEYPVCTAALSVKALSHPENAEHRAARDAWVKYLQERQLNEKLGWKPEDKQYGGWGYCRVLPRKPQPNQFAPPLIESNLSATLFALDALKAAEKLDAATAQTAVVFVRRCQNWPLLQPHQSPFVWSQYRDGGFHFIYDDPTRNKAGMAHADPMLFHSYGSTTADGFRALRLCAQLEDEPRQNAAASWIKHHFRADTHPGEYLKAHEINRDAVYFYYAASVSRVLPDLGMPDARSAALAAALVKRQRDDGSWANAVELVRENEPIVATSNAVTALAYCKQK